MPISIFCVKNYRSKGIVQVGNARLLGLLPEVGDQVVPVLGLLQTTERHLGAWNVLLRVLEVLELDG